MIRAKSNKTHCKRGHELKEENLKISKDGIRRCKICLDIRTKIYQEKNKEKIRQRSRAWALANPERMREHGRKADKKRYPQRLIYRRTIWWKPYQIKLKTEVLTHYGNGKLACVCCGENILLLLTLDHIEGRKNEYTSYNNRSFPLLQKLRVDEFPLGFQTLCWNCNSGRARNSGICPHKTDEIIETNYPYRTNNPTKHGLYMRTYHKKYVVKLREQVLTHYGDGKLACICCGTNKVLFLTLDHINGRKEHEKKNPSRRSWQLMGHLRNVGYPEGYQTLCFNCNSGRALNNGICPHKEQNLKSIP